MRKKIIAGNWKMNFTPSKAVEFINTVKSAFDSNKVDVVLCVPYVSLSAVQEALAGTNIKVGAQNIHYMSDGAYTGEISGAMLKDMNVPYVIIGHSERRESFGETDTTVNLKTIKALEYGLVPIVCIGESLKQRKQERTEGVLRKQTSLALDGLSPEEVASTVIAYEPIWAIGTGETATTAQAEEACAIIRSQVAKLYDQETADKVRILYGGSVTPANATELFAMKNIDGGLVGGASMLPTFEKVVHFG